MVYYHSFSDTLNPVHDIYIKLVVFLPASPIQTSPVYTGNLIENPLIIFDLNFVKSLRELNFNS